jgi:hypothetical protein
MASGAVSAAIEDYLIAHWATTPLLMENDNRDAVSGVPLPPSPDPAPFVEVNFSGRSYGQASLGASVQSANRWDEDGFVSFDVLVPINTTSRVARTNAKSLADLFRGLLLLNGSLEFLDAAISSGSPSSKYNGNYYVIPVDIEWRRVDA